MKQSDNSVTPKACPYCCGQSCRSAADLCSKHFQGYLYALAAGFDCRHIASNVLSFKRNERGSYEAAVERQRTRAAVDKAAAMFVRELLALAAAKGNPGRRN